MQVVWIVRSRFGHVLGIAGSVPQKNRIVKEWEDKGFTALTVTVAHFQAEIDHAREQLKKREETDARPVFNGLNLRALRS